MSSRAEHGSPSDEGLLSPVSSGTVAEALTGDAALVTAMVTVEAALVRALVDAGLASGSASAVADAVEQVELAARDLPVVARTLTQHAMPTTFGFRVPGWLAGVHDAVRVVRTCTTLPVSLGGPVGTAAAYGERGPQVLDAFAARLGQRAAVSSWHTRRTPVVGLGTALTVTGAACATIAADVLVLSRTEVGEVGEGTGGPSSAMPHKTNPARSVLVASAARQLPALGSVLASSAAVEDERPAGAWHAEWQPLRTMLRLAGGAAEHTAGLVAGLRLDRDAMARNPDRLVAELDHDDRWAGDQTTHAGAWIDRVLAQHEEVFQ